MSYKIIIFDVILVLFLCSIYLILFKTEIPSADGLVYVRNIDAQEIMINPNHILMNPIGFYCTELSHFIGFNFSTIDVLKIISGLSSIISIILFYILLIKLGVRQYDRLERFLYVFLLFFSNNFLSMAISEEFFMIQMPLLLLIVFLIVKWQTSTPKFSNYYLFISGCLSATLSGILISNVFFVAIIFIIIFIESTANIPKKFINTLIYGSGFISILLIFLFFGYFYLNKNDSFLAWLLSYQGVSENPTNQLYGIKLSLKEITISLIRLIFNIPRNIVDLGGFGSFFKEAIFSDELEFKPQYFNLFLNLITFIVASISLLFLFKWLSKKWHQLPIIRLSVLSISSFLLFNLYWSDSSDQFWFQILPFIWICFYYYLNEIKFFNQYTTWVLNYKIKLKNIILFVFVILLFSLNTLNVVWPKTFVNVSNLRTQHKKILKSGDLEILPGWDGLYWLTPDNSFPQYDRIFLMEIALKSAEFNLMEFESKIHQHIMSGNRVIVSRLFDKDYIARPWDQLKKLGWSRQIIIRALDKYDSIVIGEINGIFFRELRIREPE